MFCVVCSNAEELTPHRNDIDTWLKANRRYSVMVTEKELTVKMERRATAPRPMNKNR